MPDTDPAPGPRLALPLDGTPVRIIPPVDVDAHEATNPEENLR